MTRVRKRENFYRRDPDKALRGMWGLSLEERGAYNILIDLMYLTWRPLPDDNTGDRQQIVAWFGCAAQKVNPIIRSLIEKGRIHRVRIGGKWYLTDDAFEREHTAVKGEEVRAKSGEVAVKSEEVEEKSRLLSPTIEENQQVDGAREEKEKEKSVVDTRAHEDDWPENGALIETLIADVAGDIDLSRQAWPLQTVREVLAWKMNGFSYALDVVPTIKPMLVKRRVMSWAYFTTAVAEAHAVRTRVIELPDAVARPAAFKTFATQRAEDNSAIFDDVFGGRSE